jgi:hypothetical protein
MKVQLTKAAQGILNQIMSADAVGIEHGTDTQRASVDDILISSKGIQFSLPDDDFCEISNETLNKAYIKDNVILIDEKDHKYGEGGDIIITLYRFSKFAAL